jgi:hypothetical protein
VYSDDDTMTQLTHMAIERNSEKRAEFNVHISRYKPEQLVFFDESSVDCCTTYRGKAWAIKGQKATHGAFFC